MYERNVNKIVNDMVARAQKNLNENIRDFDNLNLAALLLGSAGFDCKLPHSLWLECEVSRDQLPAVRQALGAGLKKSGMYPHNKTKRLVKMHLSVEKFPGLTITCIVKLPRAKPNGPKPKCKIKMVRSSSSYLTVVCDRDEENAVVH